MTLSCEKGFLAGKEDDRCRLRCTRYTLLGVWANGKRQMGLAVDAQQLAGSSNSVKGGV